MSDSRVCLVTAWHQEAVRDAFCEAWKITGDEPHVVLQQDPGWKSCARTKNAGITEAVMRGAEIIVVLDDDCLPISQLELMPQYNEWDKPLLTFLRRHEEALNPQPVELFQTITTPRSRGTPHLPESRTIMMPVAATMSYWQEVGDYDAPSQLAYGAKHPMQFWRGTIHGRYFPLSGMALAFKTVWWPVCQFIDVNRFDDIFAGLIWQRIAYDRGFCFNVGQTPDVWHSRQSSVWSNLRDEVIHLEANETLWQKIRACSSNDYATLRALLPV